MPNVSAVNLSSLQSNKSGSATALMNLAHNANGPLRLQKKVEGGITVKYLGVRTWSTYFFEKIIATSTQIRKAKLKTQKAIDEHVRSYLNNSGIKYGANAANAESITASLQSKVVGSSVSPAPSAAAVDKEASETGRRRTDENVEVFETTTSLFRGTGIVPSGLSVAVVPPLRMIADLRLVNEATFTRHPKGDSRRGLTYSLSEFPRTAKKTGVNDFRTYYLDILKSYAGVIQTSVVMELQLDAGGKCSEDNREGACSAAKEFVGLQKLQGKHVSVMLTVPKLPSAKANSTATVVDIPTRNVSKSNDVLVQDPSNESSSEQSD